MTQQYVVIYGNTVINHFVRLELAMKCAEKFVKMKRENQSHDYDTIIAVVLGDDCRYTAGS